MISPITDEAVDEFETTWRQLLKLGREGDAHWEWRDLVADYREGYMNFWLQADGACQGLMIVKEKDWLRGREGGERCCYLARLSSAPWNRRKLRERVDCGRPRIKPVGSCLIARAVQLSVELGFGGRLGWHSLPGAVSDYERAFGEDLENLGEDYAEGLPWLEVGSEAALEFLKKMEPYMLSGI